MNDDTEDILNSVKTHGIRSPFNFHAIKSTFILWPTACESCEKTIYPFSSVVVCIKCKIIFHRGPCMRDTRRVCEHATKKANTTVADDLVVVEEKISVESLSRNPAETEHQSSEPLEPIQAQHATVNTSTIKNPSVNHNDEVLLRKDEKTELTTTTATVIISSVWSSKARSLASSQLQRLERVPFPIPSSSNPILDESTLKTLQLFVHHTLADPSSFPCKVCSALHATYMNMKFTTHKDVLMNGRACLDAVIASFLSILPASMETNKPNNTTLLPPGIEEGVSHAVDRYMLTMARTSMYDKLYHASTASTEEQDQHWRSMVLASNCAASTLSTHPTTSLTTNTTTATSTANTTTTTNTTILPPSICNHHHHTDAISNPHSHSHHHSHNHNHGHSHRENITKMVSVDAKKALLRVGDFVSPKDKLVQLCVALNCLTTTKLSHLDTSAQSNLTAPSQSSQSNLTVADSGQSSSIIDSTAPQSSSLFFDGHPTNVVGIDTTTFDDHGDKPTNQVSTAATDDLLELPMVDTDELIEKLACLLINTGDEMNWYAECHYIEHMMHQEGVWVYGQECYALTTVMQALQSTLSP